MLYALARVGSSARRRLRSSRRMVILGIAIFSAIATPGGDLVSPVILGATMYILFELTIVAIRRSGTLMTADRDPAAARRTAPGATSPFPMPTPT